MRHSYQPLLPPTDLSSCGVRCVEIKLNYEKPITIVLHDLEPWEKLGLAVLVTVLSHRP